MNIKNYLNRIKYDRDLNLSLQVLSDLQKAHLLHVPFENLDIHSGVPIELDLDKIFYKVVEKERGGFCYELNGLFYSLLKELGFEASIISARVYDHKKEEFGMEYDHLAILVNLEEFDYLVDVGFGEFVFHPLKFEMGKVQSDPRGNFVIEKDVDDYYKVSKITDGEKLAEYIFTIERRKLSAFTEMCRYHQTSPQSHFTQKRLISKPTPKGRITIAGNTLKISEFEELVLEKKFAKEEFEMYLRDWFEMEQ